MSNALVNVGLVAALLGATGCGSTAEVSGVEGVVGSAFRYCKTTDLGVVPLVYPDRTIQEHEQAGLRLGYPERVRQAAADVLQQVFQRKAMNGAPLSAADAPLTGPMIRDLFLTMYCHYTGSDGTPWDVKDDPVYAAGDLKSYYYGIQLILKDVVDPTTGLSVVDEGYLETIPVLERSDRTIPPWNGYPQKLVPRDLGLEGVPMDHLPAALFERPFRFLPQFSFHGYIGLHPAAYPAAYERFADVLNRVLILADDPTFRALAQADRADRADLLLGELSFVGANLLPFGPETNWGLVDIFLVFSTRALILGDVLNATADRQTNGLDWYQMLVARKLTQAVAIHRAWRQGLLDRAYYGPAGATLRARNMPAGKRFDATCD